MPLHVPILSLLLCPFFVTVPFVLLLVPFLPQSDLSLLYHTVLHRCHSGIFATSVAFEQQWREWDSVAEEQHHKNTYLTNL